jgi:hypothetical protein
MGLVLVDFDLKIEPYGYDFIESFQMVEARNHPAHSRLSGLA